MTVTARVPGSLVLIGEHAVLRGGVAIAAAIDQFITVTLHPRVDEKILIHSTLGHYETDIHHCTPQAPFTFVLAALQRFQPEFKTGFDLNIESDFSHTVGFGSSAAVTVATIEVCEQWLHGKRDQWETFHHARAAMLAVQTIGSGTDIAASTFGGVIAYQMHPLSIESLNVDFPITAVYVGYKTPTVAVLKIVAEAEAKNPERYRDIFEQMKKISAQAKEALLSKNTAVFFESCQQYQTELQNLGVSDEKLEALIARLNTFDNIAAAKISGSGLGDCVVGLGTLVADAFPENEAQRKWGVQAWNLQVAHR